MINAAALSDGKFIPVMYSDDSPTEYGEFVLVQSPVILVQRFFRGHNPDSIPLTAEIQKKILRDLEE